MTLTDFLLARIEEDYAKARDDGADAMTGWQWKHLSKAEYARAQNGGIAAAKRLAAECEARLRLVEGAEDEMGLTTAEGWLFPFLALPYADHEDYNPDWRP